LASIYAQVMTTRAARILICDDDPTVAEVMGRYLEREGFTVDATSDGDGAMAASRVAWPDLVLLDLMLPGVNGTEVFRQLRQIAPVPVVMLTALGDPDDRIAGLEMGADDYVAKPFSPREVTARICAVLNRAQLVTAPLPPGPWIEFGDVVIDVSAQRVTVGANDVDFTPREFDLLVHFAQHPDVVFRREELLETVWGWSFGDTSTVTVHVRRLREKVESDPAAPTHLVTVWGVGYRFER
jgi:two-component system response regulator ResD